MSDKTKTETETEEVKDELSQNPGANLLFMKVWLDKYNTNKNQKLRSDEPSEFMKQYVEATYNLFQIQQKRIDDLEQILKEYIV